MLTPFDRLKAAWNSSDPGGELNRAVEKMAAEGSSRNQLDDALGKLLDEVRAAGGGDETEEMINSVGDRLHDWCHESRRIRPGLTQTTTPTSVVGTAPVQIPTIRNS